MERNAVFPKGFVWGAAASSYQVEGAAASDGKGSSIWDAFCHRGGTTWRGQTGDVACDHYHRYRDDVKLMRSIGLGGYRLSVSWPRILPEGTGRVNTAGLDFYDRLVDELVAAEIEPYVTLYHWDLPSELHRRGGWLTSDCSQWFADYSAIVVERLSDRVQHWITLNEPQVIAHNGYLDGQHAPGDRLELAEVLKVGHHTLLAHGRAVQTIRATSKRPSRIGFAPVGVVFVPATSRAEDVAAAACALRRVDGAHMWNNSWWLDPVLKGCYPPEGIAAYGDAVPAVGSADMAIISQPLDFLGSNIYTAGTVSAGADGHPVFLDRTIDSAVTSMDWDVVPDSLYWGPRLLWEQYATPLIITENGMAAREWVCLDGAVHDAMRIDFLRRHLCALRRAIVEGIPVTGYFHWSIMDNFEWARGYRERFGLIHVDFATQKRILKDSAHWYRKIIASSGAALDDDACAHPSAGSMESN